MRADTDSPHNKAVNILVTIHVAKLNIPGKESPHLVTDNSLKEHGHKQNQKPVFYLTVISLGIQQYEVTDLAK